MDMDSGTSKIFIKEIHIENFKCFKGSFNLAFNEGMNILVGDNEAGKTTILEAVNLTLTGLLNGKFVKNDISQYLFNNESINEYLSSLKGKPSSPPRILIELYLDGDNLADLRGNNNSKGEDAYGIYFQIDFDEKYKVEYEKLIREQELSTLPVEYYDVTWMSFARKPLSNRSIPLKSALIDSSTHRYQSGSDVYISRIVRQHLDTSETVAISQAHRKMRETFMNEPSIENINSKIRDAARVSSKEIKISVDLSSKNAWETSLMTYLDEVPFHFIGKGEQTAIKTKLALSHKKAQESNVILLEEPENHLSHGRLNQLLHELKQGNENKQVILSTHSSFVANKLGLGSLILLHNQNTTTLNSLSEDTRAFFERLAGYDTLRVLLCEKAILVEGDSDELVLQKAYMQNNQGKLPIDDNIDVISVGTAFLRFLEIAEQIKKPVSVVTDNDGDVDAINKKYASYLGPNQKDYIKICFDEVVDDCPEIEGKQFNCNTLEPKLTKINGLEKMNQILGESFESEIELHKHMRANKTECALKIFSASIDISFPQYIVDAINQ